MFPPVLIIYTLTIYACILSLLLEIQYFIDYIQKAIQQKSYMTFTYIATRFRIKANSIPEAMAPETHILSSMFSL